MPLCLAFKWNWYVAYQSSGGFSFVGLSQVFICVYEVNAKCASLNKTAQIVPRRCDVRLQTTPHLRASLYVAVQPWVSLPLPYRFIYLRGREKTTNAQHQRRNLVHKSEIYRLMMGSLATGLSFLRVHQSTASRSWRPPATD